MVGGSLVNLSHPRWFPGRLVQISRITTRCAAGCTGALQARARTVHAAHGALQWWPAGATSYNTHARHTAWRRLAAGRLRSSRQPLSSAFDSYLCSQHRATPGLIMTLPFSIGSGTGLPGETPSTGSLPPLPTFTPTASPLDLLAAAAARAAAARTARPTGRDPSCTPLSQAGPYNPAASLPTRVVKKLLELEFVEMADISIDDEPPPHTVGLPPIPGRPPIQDISIWMERFSIMAAVLSSRFPNKAPELFAYQASILRAERNYDDKRWVAYDRRYRREALAQKDLNWSIPNPRLYNEAFTGRARSIPRCSYCLQEDHVAQYCPRNPNRPWLGWLPDPFHGHPTAMTNPLPLPAQVHNPTSLEVCRRFNEGRCKQVRCRFTHACKECNAPHPWITCPRNAARGSGRTRSPFRQQRQGPLHPLGPPGPRYP